MSEQEKRPVFVFLDEGALSLSGDEKEEFSADFSNHQLHFTNFPELMKSLGIFDFQVVFLIKKIIFWDKCDVRKFLFRHPRPLFMFLTNDKNFIEDALVGFENWKSYKKKRKRVKRGIILKNNKVILTQDGQTVELHIFYVGTGPRTVIKNKSLEILHSFLDSR